jgi:DNA-binding beta-propeller fold protein YncE
LRYFKFEAGDRVCYEYCADNQPGKPTLVHVIPRGTGYAGVGSLALYDDHLFVGRDGFAQVEVYNTTTWSLQRHLSIAGLGNYVRGLAACDHNKCLYVSANDRNRVYKVDLSTYRVALEWSAADHPWGLSVNTAHNLLVACSAASKLQEYSSDGLLVREICITGGNPTHGIQLSNSQIVVSQYGTLHRVCVIGADGQIKRLYGSNSGSGIGKLCNPFCLAVNQQGCVLVADHSNHRILALNQSLDETRQIVFAPNGFVRHPTSLYLDESRNRLYVGENCEWLRVLVFDNVSGISTMFSECIASHSLE